MLILGYVNSYPINFQSKYSVSKWTVGIVVVYNFSQKMDKHRRANRLNSRELCLSIFFILIRTRGYQIELIGKKH